VSDPSAQAARAAAAENARLVALCLAGDRSAWETLVRRHERLVYAIARGYRLGDEDLGDVFQEVFAALARGLPRLRDPRSLVRWLSSTTERIARATALRRRREIARSIEIDDPDAPEFSSEGPAVGADLERLEEQALVRLALAQLADRCRALLEALYYEDPTPSYAELAERLRLPIGSLGPTRARCFDRLRQILSGLMNPREGRISQAPPPTSSLNRTPGDDRPRGADVNRPAVEGSA
jgi:RNA polymerase sigma factor (sigma-70 family)